MVVFKPLDEKLSQSWKLEYMIIPIGKDDFGARK